MSLRYRKHIRLPDHDYMRGVYFVTTCTYWRKQVFGRIIGTGADARMELTDVGRIVDECWRIIPDHFPHVCLHEMQVMPDHLHAIIELNGVSDMHRIGDPMGRDYGCRRWTAKNGQGPRTWFIGCDHRGIQIGNHQACEPSERHTGQIAVATQLPRTGDPRIQR